MEHEDILVIRRRDMLRAPCPRCFEAKLRTFADDQLLCMMCNAVFPRYLTKAELINLLEKEEENDTTELQSEG